MKTKSQKKSFFAAWTYLTFFIIFILLGIAIKRLVGHPEFVVLFHIPAAVFLILCGLQFKKQNETQYEKEIREIRNRLNPEYKNQNF